MPRATIDDVSATAYTSTYQLPPFLSSHLALEELDSVDTQNSRDARGDVFTCLCVWATIAHSLLLSSCLHGDRKLSFNLVADDVHISWHGIALPSAVRMPVPSGMYCYAARGGWKGLLIVVEWHFHGTPRGSVPYPLDNHVRPSLNI